MKLNYNSNKLTKVSDIQIPDRFFNRMKTGYDVLDNLFGGGILQGLTFTLTASPGTGKTTFLLQLLDTLQKRNYNTGYFTGEEDVRQVAYSCKRLGVTEVPVCNVTDVDEICKMTKDLDLIVIDSFPCLTTQTEMSKGAREKYIVEKLIEASEMNGCAIGIILHVTKSGDYKGGTLIPHAVGANFMLEISEENPDEQRVISSTKNRYGSTANMSIEFGSHGFDFGKATKLNGNNVAPSKADVKAKLLDKLATMKEPPGITMQRVMNELSVDRSKAYILLKEMTDSGKLKKFGRGDEAVWKHTNVVPAN